MRAQNDGENQIQGTVVSTGGELMEVAVIQAFNANQADAVPYTAIALEDGSYTLGGLPDGTYILKAFAPWHIGMYYDNVYDPSDAEPIVVSADQPAPIVSFSLEPIFYYLAEPEDADGGRNLTSMSFYGEVQTARGEALDGATVYVLSEDGSILSSGETRQDGSYQIEALVPGQGYKLKATHAGYESRFHGDAASLEAADDLKLEAGKYEVNFVLEPSSTSTSSDKPETDLPTEMTLKGNYPNPFNPTTRIVFTLPEAMPVTVTVYDALGRTISELFNGVLTAGEQSIVWDTTSLDNAEVTSGMYFYHIQAGGDHKTGKMMLIR